MEKFTFIILCPDSDGGLTNTVNSIKAEYGVDFPKFAVVGKSTEYANVEYLSKSCKIHKGGNTITSLIDTGIDHSETDWNFILFAGTRVKAHVIRKYQYFIKDEKDILFPVVDRKFAFHEASMNGIFVNKLAFKEIGKMGDDISDLEIVKLIWATKGLEKQFRFKAIVGGKMV
jgi:hypothetical protein